MDSYKDTQQQFTNMCQQLHHFKALQDNAVLKGHLTELRDVIRKLKQNTNEKDTKLNGITTAITNLLENLVTENPFALIENFTSVLSSEAELTTDSEKLNTILSLVKQATEGWQNTQKSIQVALAKVSDVLQNSGDSLVQANLTPVPASFDLGSEDIAEWQAFQKQMYQPNKNAEQQSNIPRAKFIISSVPPSPPHGLATIGNQESLTVQDVEEAFADIYGGVCQNGMENWRNYQSSVEEPDSPRTNLNVFVFPSPVLGLWASGISQAVVDVEDTCNAPYELGNDDIAAWRAFQENHYFSNGNNLAYAEHEPESPLALSHLLFETEARSDGAVSSSPSKRRKTEEDRMDVAHVLVSLAHDENAPADSVLPQHGLDNTAEGFKCFCGLTCKDEAGLYAHIRQKEEGTIFHCKRCDGMFEEIEDVKRHMGDVHPPPPSRSRRQMKLCRKHGMRTRSMSSGSTTTDSAEEMDSPLFTSTPMPYRGQKRMRGARRVRLAGEALVSSRAAFSGRIRNDGLQKGFFPRWQS